MSINGVKNQGQDPQLATKNLSYDKLFILIEQVFVAKGLDFGIWISKIFKMFGFYGL